MTHWDSNGHVSDNNNNNNNNNNNVTLSGSLQTVEQDVITIIDAAPKTGLQLNTDKCEVIMEDSTGLPTSSVFNSFVRVEKAEMTLLGSPVLKGTAQNAAINHKTVSYTHLTLPTIYSV